MKVRAEQHLSFVRVVDVEDPYDTDEVEDAIWSAVCGVPRGRAVFEALGIRFDRTDVEEAEA